jgi:hypothetical protein
VIGRRLLIESLQVTFAVGAENAGEAKTLAVECGDNSRIVDKDNRTLGARGAP